MIKLDCRDCDKIFKGCEGKEKCKEFDRSYVYDYNLFLSSSDWTFLSAVEGYAEMYLSEFINNEDELCRTVWDKYLNALYPAQIKDIIKEACMEDRLKGVTKND